jgi:hypothetical protein
MLDQFDNAVHGAGVRLAEGGETCAVEPSHHS